MGDEGALRRGLTAGLFVVLLISLTGVVYVAMDPPPAEQAHTEAYLLDDEGNATEYPDNLTVGENGSVTAGVVNHEHTAVTYTVTLQLDNRSVSEHTVDIADDEQWERTLSFTPSEPGRQRLLMSVYRDGGEDPYRTVWLWVTVTEANTTLGLG